MPLGKPEGLIEPSGLQVFMTFGSLYLFFLPRLSVFNLMAYDMKDVSCLILLLTLYSSLNVSYLNVLSSKPSSLI